MWYVICDKHDLIGFKKQMYDAEFLINDHHKEQSGDCRVSLFQFGIEPTPSEIEEMKKKLSAYSNVQHRDLT